MSRPLSDGELVGSRSVNQAVRITLRVSPGAATSRIVGRYLEGWKLRVTARPESGKANAAVVQLLADALSLPPREVTIVAGHTSRTKVVEVCGLAADAVDAALERAARPAG